MNRPSDPLPPPLLLSKRTKAFLAWLAVIPLLAGLCVVGMMQLPLWFIYLLPYALGLAALVILVAVLAVGGATQTLGASVAGLFGGVGLLFLIYGVFNAAN